MKIIEDKMNLKRIILIDGAKKTAETAPTPSKMNKYIFFQSQEGGGRF